MICITSREGLWGALVGFLNPAASSNVVVSPSVGGLFTNGVFAKRLKSRIVKFGEVM